MPQRAEELVWFGPWQPAGHLAHAAGGHLLASGRRWCRRPARRPARRPVQRIEEGFNGALSRRSARRSGAARRVGGLQAPRRPAPPQRPAPAASAARAAIAAPSRRAAAEPAARSARSRRPPPARASCASLQRCPRAATLEIWVLGTTPWCSSTASALIAYPRPSQQNARPWRVRRPVRAGPRPGWPAPPQPQHHLAALLARWPAPPARPAGRQRTAPIGSRRAAGPPARGLQQLDEARQFDHAHRPIWCAICTAPAFSTPGRGHRPDWKLHRPVATTTRDAPAANSGPAAPSPSGQGPVHQGRGESHALPFCTRCTSAEPRASG